MEVEVMDDEDAEAIERYGSVNTSQSDWSIHSSLDGAEIHAGVGDTRLDDSEHRITAPSRHPNHRPNLSRDARGSSAISCGR